MKRIVFLLLVVLSYLSCDCISDDCMFTYLKPPVVIKSITIDEIVCIDSRGRLWRSNPRLNSNHIAQAIMSEDRQVGDTVPHPRGTTLPPGAGTPVEPYEETTK